MSASIVRMLDAATGARLRDRLEQVGFVIGTAPYAHWSAKGPGVSVTHYLKGKLLVQGKDADEFSVTYMDDPDDPLFGSPATSGSKSGKHDNLPPGANDVTVPIIGTDESGKGDYFGPLVTAGVLLRPADAAVLAALGVRDSKEVKDKEALSLAGQIEEAYGDRVCVVAIGPARYNELHGQFGGNLNRLLAWAHGTVIATLIERHPECRHALVDRFASERLVAGELNKREIDIDLQQRVRAEAHPAVAAASIVARARFLRALDRLSRDAGVKLRKGAGAPVDAVARELFLGSGLEKLRGVAKLHFRTTDKARGTA